MLCYFLGGDQYNFGAEELEIPGAELIGETDVRRVETCAFADVDNGRP